MIDIKQVYNFAEKKHLNQQRKGKEPYFEHLVQTAEYALQITKELSYKYPYLNNDIQDIEYTSILHDIIENTDTDYNEIMTLTNTQVANWVSALSEDKRLPKKIRYKIYNDAIENSCIQIKIIKLADIYSNLIALNTVDDTEWIFYFAEKCSYILPCLEKELENVNLYYESKKIVNNYLGDN